jgi:hypothetical protein
VGESRRTIKAMRLGHERGQGVLSSDNYGVFRYCRVG